MRQSVHRSAWGTLAAAAVMACGLPAVGQSDESAAERGRIALTSTGYLPPAWSDQAHARAGRLWGDGSPDPEHEPEAYAEAFRKRYGLHAAPFENDGLPMGLRRGNGRNGTKTGIQIDCMVCHGGSIGGQSYVGLGNTTLDLQSLLADLSRSEGRVPFAWGFNLNTTRGLSNAGSVSALLLSFRNTDMSRRVLPLPLGARLPEMDTPAWWLLGRKATMYYDGRTDSDSARSLMQFLLGDLNLAELKELEPTFKDILAYLKSLKPPRYPFEIDRPRADRGQAVFVEHCAKCHGTYGPDGKYPNTIVELKVIGTDPARARGLSARLVAHYNNTWFAEEFPADETMIGYQAPPLDGLWATAPYLHNGSVPTLMTLLNSANRPARYRRPPSTDFSYYDKENVGWKVEPAAEPPDPAQPVHEARWYYDTSRFGLGNSGHTFGDKLSDDERRELIEYLKTL
jgi:Cytochrome c